MRTVLALMVAAVLLAMGCTLFWIAMSIPPWMVNR